MAVAERKLEILASKSGLVADAGNFQLLLEAFGDADDQIVDPGAGGAPQRASALGFETRINLDRVVVENDRDVVMNLEGQFALRALDGDVLAFDRGCDAGRHGNGLLTDTRHCASPPDQKTVASTSPPT